MAGFDSNCKMHDCWDEYSKKFKIAAKSDAFIKFNHCSHTIDEGTFLTEKYKKKGGGGAKEKTGEGIIFRKIMSVVSTLFVLFRIGCQLSVALRMNSSRI